MKSQHLKGPVQNNCTVEFGYYEGVREWQTMLAIRRFRYTCQYFIFTITGARHIQDLTLTAACLPKATKNFIGATKFQIQVAWLGNWNFCESCRLTWIIQKLSIVIQQKYFIGRKTQSKTASLEWHIASICWKQLLFWKEYQQNKFGFQFKKNKK